MLKLLALLLIGLLLSDQVQAAYNAPTTTIEFVQNHKAIVVGAVVATTTIAVTATYNYLRPPPAPTIDAPPGSLTPANDTISRQVNSTAPPLSASPQPTPAVEVQEFNHQAAHDKTDLFANDMKAKMAVLVELDLVPISNITRALLRLQDRELRGKLRFKVHLERVLRHGIFALAPPPPEIMAKSPIDLTVTPVVRKQSVFDNQTMCYKDSTKRFAREAPLLCDLLSATTALVSTALEIWLPMPSFHPTCSLRRATTFDNTTMCHKESSELLVREWDLTCELVVLMALPSPCATFNVPRLARFDNTTMCARNEVAHFDEDSVCKLRYSVAEEDIDQGMSSLVLLVIGVICLAVLVVLFFALRAAYLWWSLPPRVKALVKRSFAQRKLFVGAVFWRCPPPKLPKRLWNGHCRKCS